LWPEVVQFVLVHPKLQIAHHTSLDFLQLEYLLHSLQVHLIFGTIHQGSHLSVLETQLVDYDCFSLVRQLEVLVVDVLQVLMSNDFSIGELDFTSFHEFYLGQGDLLEGLLPGDSLLAALPLEDRGLLGVRDRAHRVPFFIFQFFILF